MMKQFLRVKQLADQTFSRSGKSEALSDELQLADRKVENVKGALQALCKRLGPVGGVAQGQDPSAREKRLKKIPEYLLGLSMIEASNFDDAGLLKYVMQECGKAETSLANEIADHEVKVEQLVHAPLISVNEQDLPNISKAKKHLSRLMNEKDNAASRVQYLQRQNEQNPTKVVQAREEAEEAELKAEQARDALAADMFTLLAKENELANTILQYVKLKRAYHESALHTLTEIVPHLEKHLNDSAQKPLFGFPLEEHLRVAERTIAYPLELCVCALQELGLEEEGLFRIAGGSSRMKRMKLSLDAGIFCAPLPPEYRDVHVIAGVLKSYLRELPEPLLTYQLHDTFMAAITKNPTEEARFEALQEAIACLPDPNFNNLRYLIKFLSTLTKNQAVNKMTPYNIAIVVAPNLLWGGDDGSGAGFNMSNATTINCIVEILIKNADRFFKDEVNFYVTFTKEDLFPDLCDFGFVPSFGSGTYNRGFNPAHDHRNGDYTMSKSMHEYSSHPAGAHPLSAAINASVAQSKQTHSRSNSHDTSLILVDDEFKRTQSNSSLSDHSSPPHGSPKPITRRKNKPIAPVPPNFTPPDKSQQNSKHETKDNGKIFSKNNDVEKPDKPPRPIVAEAPKQVTGVQTINRSTYKSKISRLGQKLTGSRENLTDMASKERRKSFEFEHDKVGESERTRDMRSVDKIQSIVAHHGTVGKITVTSDQLQTGSVEFKNPISVKCGKQSIQAPSEAPPIQPKPVAAPRSIIPSVTLETEATTEAQMRPKPIIEPIASGCKPAIPERPATLRPQSFKGNTQKFQSLETLTAADFVQNGAPTVLERTHVYTVDKQHPTIIRVGNAQDKQPDNPARPTEATESLEGHIDGIESESDRTQGTGAIKAEEQLSLASQMRKLSQSEGNILDTPPSPRFCHRPPRPQIPAPPPPTAGMKQKPDGSDSTDL